MATKAHHPPASRHVSQKEQQQQEQHQIVDDFEQDALQREIDEMHARTKNCLRLGYEARQMGADTMTELHSQGEKLDKIHEKTYDIHDNLSAGARALRGIESFWGSVANRWTNQKYEDRTVSKPANPSTQDLQAHQKQYEKDLQKKQQQEAKNNKNINKKTEPPKKSAAVDFNSLPDSSASAPDPQAPRRQQLVDQALKQNDKMLDELSGVAGDLKAMALEMNATISSHNDKLDQISSNVGRAQTRIKNDTRRIEKLL